MSSLYLHPTLPPFVLWAWSTSHCGGWSLLSHPHCTPINVRLGPVTCLNQRKKDRSGIKTLSGWGFKRHCLFLLCFLHSCARSEAKLSGSILLSLGFLQVPVEQIWTPPTTWNRLTVLTDCEKNECCCLPVSLGWFVTQHYDINSWLIQVNSLCFSGPSFSYFQYETIG